MRDRLGASPAYHLIHMLWAAVDWIYPPRCGGCDRAGYRWCPDCDSHAQIIMDRNICPVCGIPQTGYLACADCQNTPPPYTALRSWAVYQGGLREAIHRVKFHSDLGLAEVFALKLRDLYSTLGWTVDLVTSVPLSSRRKRERGYNQADLIAFYFALSLRLPFASAAVQRTRETQSQVGLTAMERRQNVKDAFSADPRLVDRKKILIIDDVTTTGSTLSECARACMENQAANVYGLTISRAVIDSHR